jgi:hypothetical protein
MDAMKITAPAAVQNHVRLAAHVEPIHTAPLPPAPPELVNRFEALMARVPSPAEGSLTQAPQTQAAVAGVENHMRHHAEMLDRISAVADGDLNMATVTAVQMQSMLDMATMSMEQSACLGLVSSTKGAVSDLMKTQ